MWRNQKHIEMKKACIFSAAIIAALSSCDTCEKKGVVVEKWHEPADEYLVSQYNPVLKMPTLQPYKDDEDWVLKAACICGGKTNLRRLEVSKGAYDLANVGDSVCVK